VGWTDPRSEFHRKLEPPDPPVLNSKYQFMEEQMLRKRRSLEEKIPELEKTLDAVTFFISKKVTNSWLGFISRVTEL
jgi:hypothetical protein